MSKKFSIVVPSYNQGGTIGQTLDSLIAQKQDVDLEIIVMDGGSTDETCQEIRMREANISKWVSQPDAGQADALIKGYSFTTGEILGWLNSDDLLLPGALKKVSKVFSTQVDIDLVYGDMLVIDCENEVIKKQREIDFDSDVLLWVYNYIPQPSAFWTRRAYDQSGGLDRFKHCAMDYELWVRMLSSGAKFKHIAEYLSCFRVYASQKNQRYRSISDLEDLEVRDNFLSRHPSKAELRFKYYWHKTRRVTKRFLAGHYTHGKIDPSLEQWIYDVPKQICFPETETLKAA